MGEVKILTQYFSVPNREDTRIAYNGIFSGLISSLSSPYFDLLTVGSKIRVVERDTFMADYNIGEIFLNFMLIKEVSSFCVVDVTNMMTEEELKRAQD